MLTKNRKTYKCGKNMTIKKKKNYKQKNGNFENSVIQLKKISK